MCVGASAYSLIHILMCLWTSIHACIPTDIKLLCSK